MNSQRDSWFLPNKVLKPSNRLSDVLSVVAFVSFFVWYAWLGLHDMKTRGCTMPAGPLWREFCGPMGWSYVWFVAAVCAGAIILFIYIVISTAPKKGQQNYYSKDIEETYGIDGLYWYDGDFGNPETDPFVVSQLTRARDGSAERFCHIRTMSRHLPLSTLVAAHKKEDTEFAYHLCTMDITAEGMTVKPGVCPRFPLVHGYCNPECHGLYFW